MQYSNYKNPNKKITGWSTATITNILKDRIYIGDLVQHKYASVNYKIKKVVKLKESEYIIIHNNHKPIIKETDYEQVQIMLKNRANECKRSSETLHILTGIGFCGKCGSRITYTKNHGTNYKIICSNYKKNGINACGNIYIDENNVICLIKNKIIENLRKRNLIKLEMDDSRREKITKLVEEIEKNKYTINQIYEDRRENVIDESIAKEMIIKYMNLNKVKEKEIEKLENTTKQIVDIIELIENATAEELRSLFLMMISRVIISKNSLTIYYNYS